jgi:1-acyl-sn-glycerol-3-phosphate acyltransferase
MFYRFIAFPIAKLVLAIGLALLGPVRIRGNENVPAAGGLLILANHLSDCDPAVLGHAISRRAHYMAKAELFKIPVLGWIIRVLRAFPVNRGSADRSAIRKAVDLLQSGQAVVMFPEGQLSETGMLQDLMPGAAMIVHRAGVPIICVGLAGTTKIIPFGKVIPRPAFGGVSATFGKPKTFNSESSHEEILKWITSELKVLSGQSLDSREVSGVK